MNFRKALYGVFAFWYFLFGAFAIILAVLPQSLGHPGQFWVAVSFVVAFLVGWVAYLVDIFRNPCVPAEKRPFWALAVGFFGPFAMPFYFLRYIGGQPRPAPVAAPAFSGWAQAAGYLGVLSVFATPAPLSIVASALALRDLRLHPEKRGKKRALFGLVMGLLGTAGLVLFIAGHA